MISHSILTFIWMLLAWLLHAILGLSPWYFALTAIAWWWSREQYWDERRFREAGQYSWRIVAFTVVKVWYPEERNMDLIAPAIVALVAATLISLL